MKRCLKTAVGILMSIGSVHAGASAYTANPDTFASIFAASQAGDSIKMVGNFGSVTMANKLFAVPLRIDASGATFSDTMFINNVKGLTFNGGYYGSTTKLTRYNMAVAAYGSANITFDKAYVVGAHNGQGLVFGTSTGITVTDSTFDGLRSGVGIVNTSGAVLHNNKSIHSPSDGFDIVGSHYVSVTNSVCTDGSPTPGAHPDCVQLYSIKGDPVQSDIHVTDNLAYGPTQGFTSFTPQNGGGLRIDFSRNVVQSTYSQGIACYACVDSTFVGNTLTTLPGAPHKVNINIIGGSDNFAYANTINGAAAPHDYDPYSATDLPADLAAVAAWTPATFLASSLTSAEWGDLIHTSLGSTVPEPGTWAMMLTGFATLGGVNRRRRAGVTA